MATVVHENETAEQEIPTKDYEKRFSKALLRLSAGSKYARPDTDVNSFKKKISKRESNHSKLKKDSKSLSTELQTRATTIKDLIETEREYLSELVQFHNVCLIFFYLT